MCIRDRTSTDHLFTVASNSTLDSSGTGPVTFSNTNPLVFNGTSNTTLTLTGTGPGVNVLTPTIADSTNTGNTTAIVKSGSGTWLLAGANTYTGGTTINSGTLQINSAASLGTASGNLNIGSGILEVVANVSTGRIYDLTNANSTIQVDPGFTLADTGNIIGNGTLNYNLSLIHI